MSQEIIGALKALKLHGMAANYPEVAAQARHTDFTPEAFLSQLLRAEQAERSVRSMAYQMGAARFPAHRDLADAAHLRELLREARVLWQRLAPLVGALFAEPNPAPLKGLLARQGRIDGELRAPLLPAAATTVDAALGCLNRR